MMENKNRIRARGNPDRTMGRSGTALARLVLLPALLAASLVSAQDGNYDPAFAAGGRRLIDFAFDTDDPRTVHVLPDRSLLLTGACRVQVTFAVSRFTGCALKLDPDGSPASWGNATQGWWWLLPLINQAESDSFEVGRSSIGPDGSIVLPLRRLPQGGASAAEAAFLTAAGALTAYVVVPPGSGETATGFSTALHLPDGRVLVAGYTTDALGDQNIRLYRFRTDTLIDATFGTAGVARHGVAGVDHFVWDLVLDGTGRIYVLANRFYGGNDQRVVVVRFLPDGSPDPAWGTGGAAEVPSYAIFAAGGLDIDSQGRVAIAGTATDPYQSDLDLVVVRLDSTGGLDPTFNPGSPFCCGGIAKPDFETILGFGASEDGTDLIVLDDDSILVGGTIERGINLRTFFLLMRLDPDGLFDPSFGLGGYNYGTFEDDPGLGESDFGQSIALDPAGYVVIAGSALPTPPPAPAGDFGVARLTLAAARGETLFANGFETP